MVRPVTDEDTGLKVLRDPPANAADIVDIVAIHGIGAHPDDTWCKHVGTAESPRWVNWLEAENMLPAVAPHARIMRYGYESQWFGEGAIRQNTSKVAERLLLAVHRERREDYLYRPLLFIAHCFGGLVVLKALVDARHEENRWPGTFASTTGLIFFGTPFRGAEGMRQTEMLAAAQCEYQLDEIQPDVLSILEPGNEFLQDVVDQFGKTRRQVNKALVACFYELKSSNVGRIVGKTDRMRFVVSESSGCLDISDATSKFSLSRTHFDMNKFGRPTEEDFETVRDVVKDMIQASPGLMAARSQCVSKHEIDFSPRCIPVGNQFVAQDAEMQALNTVRVDMVQRLPRGELTADGMQKLKGLLSAIPAAEIGPQQEKKKALKARAPASPFNVRSNSLDQYNRKGAQFECQTCAKTFPTQSAAEGHMTDTRHGSPKFPCKTCPRMFFKQDAANGHMTDTGHGSPKIPCKTCLKLFFKQDAANGHMVATGHGSPKIPCKTCPKLFFKQDAAEVHMAATGHGKTRVKKP